MTQKELKQALAIAVKAAQAAGALMHRNWHQTKTINAETQHDIKLELDVRCQKTIERILQKAYPTFGILGEEGDTAASSTEWRWVVDPIDGTVNFAYGIPHAAVCISLEQRRDDATFYDGCKPVVAVIFDPFAKELWTAILGGPARLNGRIIQASQRTSLREAIITMGFAKSLATMNQMLPAFNRLVPRVRKIRMMGSAALALAYVASGRFDGYLEYGLRRWDISAGALLVECAGGSIWQKPLKQAQAFEIIASSRALQKPLSRLR